MATLDRGVTGKRQRGTARKQAQNQAKTHEPPAGSSFMSIPAAGAKFFGLSKNGSYDAAERGDFGEAWGGIASLQLSLPAVWTGARARGFSLADVARWMCEGPARLAGLLDRKGTLAPGRDADVVVWYPDEEFSVTSALLRHRHKVTPYAGRS